MSKAVNKSQKPAKTFDHKEYTIQSYLLFQVCPSLQLVSVLAFLQQRDHLIP